MIAFFTTFLSILVLTVAPQFWSITSKLLSTNPLGVQTKTVFSKLEFNSSPKLSDNAPNYNAQAQAALIYDVGSGKVLYQKNHNNSLQIASLTKLMTALTIMQHHNPDEVVIIPDNLPVLEPQDQQLKLTAGTKFKLSELLQGLLIYSANDVANALAVWDAGSIENFSAKMNQNANLWGLKHTNFSNPSGLEQSPNNSSAEDLLKLSAVLLHSEKFKKIVNTQKTTIFDLSGNGYPITTTNQLLNLPYIYGVKTGFTTAAGQCLILLAEKNNHQIITVVLNSPDRFTESKNMIDYTFNNYIWK